MAQRVTWSPRALTDLEEIAAFIAADSPTYAKAVVRRIVNLTRSLKKFPRSGRVVPEFRESDLREVFAYSYRVIYRVKAREVLIVAVLHGRRMLEPKSL